MELVNPERQTTKGRKTLTEKPRSSRLGVGRRANNPVSEKGLVTETATKELKLFDVMGFQSYRKILV